jgi:hypothetical protein
MPSPPTPHPSAPAPTGYLVVEMDKLRMEEMDTGENISVLVCLPAALCWPAFYLKGKIKK